MYQRTSADKGTSAPLPRRCADLAAAIAEYEARGYRLDMIMPADRPRRALMSSPAGSVCLESEAVAPALAVQPSGMCVTRPDAAGCWQTGRAGMQYRDLIPSRLGGRFIASHIRIPEGGPVADYVHYHRIGFQLIYCWRGWVRVVYEDQGQPFVMRAGDCVLQPPGIRHRVLEAAPGLEVIEVASPAEHETWRDHEIDLPTARFDPNRDFGGQRFIHHVAAETSWGPGPWPGFACRDTGVDVASRGAVKALVLRAEAAAKALQAQAHALCLLHVLTGSAYLRYGDTEMTQLDTGDCAVLPPANVWYLEIEPPCEMLWISAD